MNYKDKEKKLAGYLTLLSGSEVRMAENEMSTFDAISKKAIIEFKIRNKYFDQKMLEVKKYESNLPKADAMSKDFIYVVQDPEGIYILNVSQHREAIKSSGITSIPQKRYTEIDKANKNDTLDVQFYLFPMDLMHKVVSITPIDPEDPFIKENK